MAIGTGNLIKLVTAVAFCQLAGLIGSLYTTPNIDTWYTTLSKPMLNPPSWVFGPVWTVLYVLMGIALYFVWSRQTGGKRRTRWLMLFMVQLGLNTAWSIIFFGEKQLFAALFVLGALWLAITALIILGRKLHAQVVYLLLPYLLWVSFAGYLNYSIWQLN